MAKLAKHQLVADLVEVWSQQEQPVREALAKELMDEYQRWSTNLGLGEVDWDFMRLGDSVKQRNFDAWFERVATTFLDNKDDAWLRAQHRQDVKGTKG